MMALVDDETLEKATVDAYMSLMAEAVFAILQL
jgi:hypothetical protein